jgi:hypothetical protein
VPNNIITGTKEIQDIIETVHTGTDNIQFIFHTEPHSEKKSGTEVPL